MDLKREKLRNIAIDTYRALKKPETIRQGITRPWLIPSAIGAVVRKIWVIVRDVKLDPVSLEDQLEIAKTSVAAVARLARERQNVQAAPLSITDLFGSDVAERPDCRAELFRTYGSDKSTTHDYYLAADLGGDTRFDLIIDDGLHNSQASLNTTNFALDLLKPDGVFIIEDIWGKDFPYYQIVQAVLKGQFQVDFINAKRSCIAMFRRIGA